MMLKNWHILFILISIISYNGACTLTKKVKDGTMAYQLKQYAIAIDMLEDELKQEKASSTYGQKAFFLAKSYDIVQDFPQAIKWFEKADKANYEEMSKATLAEAYKKNKQYEEASKLYQKLYTDTKLQPYRTEMEICRIAQNFKEDQSNIYVAPFSVNTKYSEYSPMFFGEDFLVFTSDRTQGTGDEIYKWTGNDFSDLFVVNLRGRQVNNFDAILNSAANEGTACFSKDLNEVFFTRCESIELRDQHCRIYFSQRPNGFWMEPEALMFFEEGTNFAHPCLIENDSVLIFSAAPKSISSTYDLYYSERVEGGWSSPELMPSSINSIGNEKFPTSVGDTLFFASDELPGYGGYDMFKTYVDQEGKWAKPQNLGLPLNSGADDFGLILDPNGKTQNIEEQGFFSSSRNIGTNDDIFVYTKYVEVIEEEEKKEEIEDPNAHLLFLSARVVEVLHEGADPDAAIIGKNPLSNAEVKIKASKFDSLITSDKNGRFLFQLPQRGTWSFEYSKPNFITNSLSIEIDEGLNLQRDSTINIELPLERIYYDKEIVIDNIFYDFDQYEIRSDAKPALDSLAGLLELNPNLRIQLSSHTDCRGEDKYNLELSEQRAKAAVKYLATKGISTSRMIPQGYGESRLKDNCDCDNCEEDQHQLNRRTTFKFIN